MQSKIAKRILTGILCISLMLQSSISVVYAKESNPIEKTKTITKIVDSGNPGQEREIPLSDGATDGGDITTKGLDFSNNMPTKITVYRAGNGYVLFTPWSLSTDKIATIELNNATIDSTSNSTGKPLISLPFGNVNLIIKGNNELYSDLTIGESSCIFGSGTNLLVTGDGTLTATGKFSEIYGPPDLNGYGIRLVNNSSFTRDAQITDQLNLMAYTEYSNKKEQEVFGSVIQNELPSADANLIIHNDAQLTLQKPVGMGDDCEIVLRNKYLSISKNAKLIIDDEVCLNIEKNDENVLPAVYNDAGSILVKGAIMFRDSRYLKDIAKMNITTQGRGAVVVNGHIIDTASGKHLFDNERGEILSKDNRGEYICGKGTMKWEPVVSAEGKLTGGTITLNNADIAIKSDRSRSPAIEIENEENVPITLNVIGNNTIDNPYNIGIRNAELALTGSGTLNGKGRMPIAYETKFDITKFSGKLNGIAVKIEKTENYTNKYATAYGTVSYSDNDDNFAYSTLAVEKGATLTIESGALLNANMLINNGTIINYGTLSLQRDVDDNELKNWVYGNLNLKGNGIVGVRQQGGSAYAQFTNDGKRINTSVDRPLDFSKETEDKGDLAKDGYHWDNRNKKLTLQNLIMWGNPSQDGFCAITLPEGENVTLELKGYNKITGFKSAVYQGTNIMTGPTNIPKENGSLTVYGDGTLLAQNQAYDNNNHEEILTTTGKFILKSGNLILASGGKAGLSSVGMEITGGSIGQNNISAPIESLGNFSMNGGKIISGGDGNLTVFGNLTLSGGELITGDGINGILVMNANVTVTGGKLTVYNDRNPMCNGIVVAVTGNEDKKVSISGGMVDIKTGSSALVFGTHSVEPGKVATGKGIFETRGMTVTTNPAGGTLKSTTILSPNNEQVTVSALTADESLKARGPELLNACTSLTAVKTPSTPSDGGNSGNGGSSGGGDSNNSGSSSNATDNSNITITTPSETKKNPNPPTRATATVPSTVTNDTIKVTLSQSTVEDAIGKAQVEAKKNGKERNGIAVEIKVDTKNNPLKNISANLPKSTVDKLVNSGVKEFRINSGVVAINLDLETLKTIQKQVGDDVTISAKKVDNSTLSVEAKKVVGNRPVFDFTITGINGKKATNFGKGEISVSIPYTLSANEKAENIVVYYIDDNGKIHEMSNCVYDEKAKTVSFTTNHFSVYAVGYKNEKSNPNTRAALDKTANPQTGDTSSEILCVIAILLMTATAMFSFAKRRLTDNQK